MICQLLSGHLGHFGQQFTGKPFVRNLVRNFTETDALTCPGQYLLSSDQTERNLERLEVPSSALKCPEVLSI